MSPNIRPSTIAKKQIDRATSSTARDYYIDAMQNLNVNPAALAAAKEDEWFAELEAIFKAHKFKEIMSKISKEDVTGPAVAFGGDNLTKGVENRQGKITNFWTKWGPKLAALAAQVNAMPDKTDEQKDAKMLAMKRLLKAAKGTWR